MPKADRIIRERNGSSIGVGRKCQHDALTAVTTVSTALKRCRILRSSHPTQIFFFLFSDFIFVLGAVRTPWILRSRYFVKWGICARARVTSARQKSGLCCVSSPLVPCGAGVPPSMGNLGQLAGTRAGLLEITSQLRLHGRKKKSTHCQSQLKS